MDRADYETHQTNFTHKHRIGFRREKLDNSIDCAQAAKYFLLESIEFVNDKYAISNLRKMCYKR